MNVIQFNLQQNIGGGEIYTSFLCRALAQLGVTTTLVCHDKNMHWSRLNLPETTRLLPVREAMDFFNHGPCHSQWILSHGALPDRVVDQLPKDNLLTGICHMPPQGRRIGSFERYDLVMGVSGYVVAGLVEKSVKTWETPLYGVADLHRGAQVEQTFPKIHQTSCYDWDMRKFRERFLSVLEPVYENFRDRPEFGRKNGISLGIVSRLATIKQFPLLFEYIVPVLKDFPRVNLEIFGAGGYASVRDLRLALQPINDRVRFWGHQDNVAAVYQQLDYLLSGLPEKEALGLNILEAQAAGLAVLAVDAPPFNETVLHERSGFLYRDPREDAGADFRQLMTRISARNSRFLPELPDEHLNRFTSGALTERMRPILCWVEQQLRGMQG